MGLIRRFLRDHLCGSLPSNPHTFLAVCLVAYWGMWLSLSMQAPWQTAGEQAESQTWPYFC